MSFLSFEDSIRQLNDLEVGAIRFEQVALPQSLGRILAHDVIADANEPPYPTAALDGYAIRAQNQDMDAVPVIADDNPAGALMMQTLPRQQAMKTFTGAVMPEGSDTLIPIENVRVEAASLHIESPVSKGFGVRPVGESYRRHERLIPAGTKIGYAQIGVMAGLGRAMVSVVIQPRVAVLSTGSELLELGETAVRPSQIRSSNHHTLGALAEQMGASAVSIGIVNDDKEAILEAFDNALNGADIVVSTGGVSVGDYDFVKEIIPSLGAKVVFQGVRIKPGQHIMIAQRAEKFIFGLPGFAYSSTVTFILFVIPLIKRLMGVLPQYEMIEAELDAPFEKRSKKTEFTPCNLRLINGRYHVDFTGKKSGTSAILTNMLEDAALLLTDENDRRFDRGEIVRVMRIV